MSNHKTTTNHDSTAENKVDIFMPIYIGDYLKDTTFLTTEQHGAYLLMLFACWQHGSIPNSDKVVCRITGLSDEEFAESKQILLSYFKISDGKIHHSRVDRELKIAKQKKSKLSVRGKSGASARWSATSNASGNTTSNATSIKQAMLKQCPSPSESHSTSSLESTSNIIISHPEYEKIRLCKPLSKITTERYLAIKRSFPKADAEKAVNIACLKATEPDAKITNADGWLINAFTFAPEKKVYNVSPLIQLGIDE